MPSKKIRKSVSSSSGSPSPRKPLLVLSGQYQNGKSTFLNCLLGGMYAVEGKGLVTTKYNAKYVFGDFKDGKIIYENGKTTPLSLDSNVFSTADTVQDLDKGVLLQVSVYSPILMGMDILDSPGCGANQQDNTIAEKALSLADFVVFVLQKTLDTREDISFLKNLAEQGKHFTVVLNCRNETDPGSDTAQSLCREIMAKIKTERLESNYIVLQQDKPVYPVNLLWAQCGLGYLEETDHQKKMKKLKVFLEDDNITPLSLLARSNFLPVRTLLSSFVSAFFNFTPTSRLSLFSTIAENWTSELIATIKE